MTTQNQDLGKRIAADLAALSQKEALAEYVVLAFLNSGKSITNLTLQKILYYIQAWHLVFLKSDLFDEAPQAWVNGPVYPSMYHTFKSFKSGPIGFPGVDVQAYPKEMSDRAKRLKLSKKQIELIDAVIEKYGKMSPFELVRCTHSEKPWSEARAGLSPLESSKNKISLVTMKEYYSSLLPKK